MKYLLFGFILVLFSCQQKQVSTDFDERVIDLITETRNGRSIELPDLYGKVFAIPDSTSENLILATKLKARGFKLTETTRAVQGITGVHTVTQFLTKDGCNCEVTKTYGRTAFVSQYDVSEKIKCE
jgi:hypothetical protein